MTPETRTARIQVDVSESLGPWTSEPVRADRIAREVDAPRGEKLPGRLGSDWGAIGDRSEIEPRSI
jgi:hypothetical protein